MGDPRRTGNPELVKRLSEHHRRSFVTNTLKMIPPKSIEQTKDMLRGCNKQSEAYQGLLQSIRSQGILDSICVKDMGDGKYMIVNGFQRLNCALDLDLPEIPAQILSIDEQNILEAQIVANSQTIETKPVEYTKGLLRLMALRPSMTMTELAARLGQSISWLQARMHLLKLIAEAQALVEEGKIGLASAYALGKCPEDLQRQLLDEAQTTSTTDFVLKAHNLLKQHKAAIAAGRTPGEAKFEPQARVQKMIDLKTAYEDGSAKLFETLNSTAQVTTAAEGFKLALAWVLHLDPISVDAAKKDFDTRAAKLKAEADARKAEREAKKAAANAAGVAATATL